MRAKAERKRIPEKCSKPGLKMILKNTLTAFAQLKIGNSQRQWLLVVFINGGASKTIIEMSKNSIRRLPKFKGGVNKFFAKNAIFNTNLYLYKSVVFNRGSVRTAQGFRKLSVEDELRVCLSKTQPNFKEFCKKH